MEDLEEIRQRMQARKQPKVLNDHSFHHFYRFAISTMTICVVALAVGCFLKINPTINIKDYINEHILSLFPVVEKVDSEAFFYQQLSPTKFSTQNEFAYALEDGIVKEVDENKMVILYQSGVEATYHHLNEIQVKTLDRLVTGEKIATYEDYFEMVLMQDGQEIEYDALFA